MLCIDAIQRVQVTNWPTPDAGWPTFYVTLGGLVVAVLAAVFAVLAFHAANEDLQISKAAQRIASRKPRLLASFTLNDYNSVVADIGGAAAFLEREAILTVSVWNAGDGERRCDAFLLEFIFTTSDLSLPFVCERLLSGPVGEEYAFSKSVQALLFPGGPAHSEKFNIAFAHYDKPNEIVIKYKLKDDYQDYPQHGHDQTTVTVPAHPQGMIIGPRDLAEQNLWNAIKPNFAGPEAVAVYTECVTELSGHGVTDSASRVTLAKTIGGRVIEQHLSKRRSRPQ